jgi:hypothetical protein
MTKSEWTTISVSPKVRKELMLLKVKGDFGSWDSLFRHLICIKKTLMGIRIRK